MKPLVRLLICSSMVTGCSHDISVMFGAEAKTREANALLAAADFEGARAAYQKILVDFPNAPNALFGAALTDLMLIGSSPPMTELTALCGQAPVDIAGILFGPRGLIAQAVEAREGQASLEVHYFPGPGEAASALNFRPTDVRALLKEPTEGAPRRMLQVSLDERDAPNARWFYFEVNVDDLEVGDDLVTSLVDGVEVDLSRMAGYAQLLDFSRSGPSAGSPSGRIRFSKAGRAVGEELRVEFIDVRLPAPLQCTGACGPAWYAIDGSVTDRVSARVEAESSRLPFGGIADDDESLVRRPAEVVALDLCSQMDDRVLAEHAVALTDLIEADARRFAAILTSPERADFDFTIPSRLFRSPADLRVNLTDVRVLAGALLTGAALAELIAEYRWLAGELQAQVEEHDWYYAEGQPAQRSRVFWPATLVANLETGFLTQPTGFDLTRARDRLREGTGQLAAALAERPEDPGLLDLAEPASARLVGELADLVGAIHRSIDSDAPVPLPNASQHRFHFRHFFDDPLDADRVRQAVGVLRLWSEISGDPGAASVSDRNPDVRFDLDVVDVRRWSDGLVSYPASNEGGSCAGGAGCASGFRCADDVCELSPPWFVTEEAWEASTRRDWPAFVSGPVSDALSVDL